MRQPLPAPGTPSIRLPDPRFQHKSDHVLRCSKASRGVSPSVEPHLLSQSEVLTLALSGSSLPVPVWPSLPSPSPPSLCGSNSVFLS